MSKKGEEISATIEETNKYREELGLAPLRVDKNKEKDAKKGSSKAPLDYWAEKEKDDKKKKREKDDRKKRLREDSNLEKSSSKDIYKSGPKIQDAVASETSDVSNWVSQHRQKKIRTDRDRDRRKETPAEHTGEDLAGMHIAHDIDKFEEGVDVTLVMADTPLLTESGEVNVEKGELENVDWKEKSRTARNNEVKAQKAGYAPEDEECAIGAGGMPTRKLLSKYDEKPTGEAGFTLGSEIEKQLEEATRAAERASLDAGGPRYQKDFFTSGDVGFQNNKFKTKKGKRRKQVKEDEEEKAPPTFKMLERPAGCDSDEEDAELYESLRKQRRGRDQGRADISTEQATMDAIAKVKEEEDYAMEDIRNTVTLTGTTQFCKSVETAVEKVDSLKSETFQGATVYKAQQQAKRKQMRGVKVAKAEKEKDEAKASVDVKAAIEQDSDEEDAGMAEAPLDMTVGSALEYLRSRDQLGNDQDTCRKRNKEHRPLETSTDDGDIKLEYRDKFGRVQNPKEAFRTISWKFHGKMPGHKNYERRLQRYEREMVLRKKANKELPTQRALSAIQKAENKPHMMLGAEK